MGLRSTLIHLRFPFSFFLFPIWLAAVSAAREVDPLRGLASFVILHLLLYPASNGFNSYYDRDEGPIGGIAKPPPVGGDLLAASLILDLLALAAGLTLLGPLFMGGLIVYGLASKLYSWDKTRIKARPIAGWLLIGIGQGGLTFLLVVASIGKAGQAGIGGETLLESLAATALLLGVYPLTQIYQHEEDARRGDLTISRLVGIPGSFILSGIFLGIGILGLGAFVDMRGGAPWTLAYLGIQLPATIYFIVWFARTLRDPAMADFRHAMRMNLLASGCLSLFFIIRLAAGGLSIAA